MAAVVTGGETATVAQARLALAAKGTQVARGRVTKAVAPQVAAAVALAVSAVMLLPKMAATAVLVLTLASREQAPDTLVVGPETVWTTLVLVV